MEPLIKCTIGRMAALCPRSTLTYLDDKLRVSLRDALPCIPLSHLIRGSLCVNFPPHPSPLPPWGEGASPSPPLLVLSVAKDQEGSGEVELFLNEGRSFVKERQDAHRYGRLL